MLRMESTDAISRCITCILYGVVLLLPEKRLGAWSTNTWMVSPLATSPVAYSMSRVGRLPFGGVTLNG